MLIKATGLPDAVSPGGATLGAVVSELRKRASRRRQVVSGILLDGEPLTPEREIEAAGRPAEEFSRLDAELAAPEDLVGRVLDGLRDAIEKIAGRAEAAAREIRGGLPARERIVEVAEGLGFVVGAMQDSGRLLALVSPEPPAPLRTALGLETVLGEVLSALAADDAVRLSDALDHELVPALDGFESEIRALRESLPRGRAL